MIAVIFSYSGWFVTAYIGDEVKRPERNLPLSLILGTAMVTALYVAINTVYLYAMPVESLKGVVNVGQVVGERLLSKGFVRGLTLAIMLAVAASINATILAGARLSYAIARGRPLPSPLGKASRPVRHSSRGPNCPGGIGLPVRCG
jgi:APA family basic amino acid/polyamine antiporter